MKNPYIAYVTVLCIPLYPVFCLLIYLYQNDTCNWCNCRDVPSRPN